MDKIYEVKLKTIGPVHIGSGEKRNKGQYVFDKANKRVYIPNDNKMMSWIIKKGLVDSFEKYYLYKNSDLFSWFKANKLLDEFKDYMEYSLSTKSLKIGGKTRLNDIELMIKDKDLSPYIPGSSLKGVIRTAVFGDYLYDFGRSETKEYMNDIRKYLNNRSNKRGRIRQLENFRKKLEQNYFKESRNHGGAANSLMKNILISDSEALSNKDLILAQKIDSFVDGKENPLPIFRESIKPGVDVKFKMKIQADSYINIVNIKNSIFNFYNEIDYNLLRHFDVEERNGEFIYIGGGSGFTSKTNIYQLLDEDMGLKVVSNILDDKFQRKGHLNDINLGVAPRTLKNTIFEGNKYEMGLCKIEFKEIEKL